MSLAEWTSKSSGLSGDARLRLALSLFESQRLRLVNTLNLADAFSAAEVRDEVFAVGIDVRNCATLLEDLYPELLAAYRSDEETMTALSPRLPVDAFLKPWSEEQIRAWHAAHPTDWVRLMAYLREQGSSGRSWHARTSILYKAMLLFVRAYQDVMYRCLLTALGQHAGAHSSMRDAATREANPVRQVLDVELTTYLAWFASWRFQRNRVKQGTNVSFQISPTELGVTFTPRSGTPQQTVSLSDIAEALVTSARLTALVVHRFTEGWDDERLAAVDRID
jgi:hypothetical protein